MIHNSRNEGYIAIISSIIVMAITIFVAIIFSSSNYLGRFDTQTLEMKDLSKEVSEGCLDHERLQIAWNSSYSGDETITVGNYACDILPIETTSSQIIIKSTAEISNRTTNLRLVIDDYSLEVISLEELSTF